jgi:hypothetical protein
MMTYQNVIDLLKRIETGKMYVPVFYLSGRHEWMPVDKMEYLRTLLQITNTNLDTLPFPCKVEIESDGEIFLHPRVENR